MAAGASPTGGVGGIFYFLLLGIGVMRHTYNRAKKSIKAEKYVASFVLLFALTLVAVINIVLVYRLVNFQLLGSLSGNDLLIIGVPLNWQFQSAVIFALTLLGMFLVGFLFMRESEKSLLYRTGCVIMSLIFIILIIWLPIGILESLHLINIPL